MRRLFILVALALLGLGLTAQATTTEKNGMVVQTQTYHDNDALVVKNTLGASKVVVEADGDVTMAGTLAVTGAVSTGALTPSSIVGTGLITATNITDVVRTIQLSLDDWRTDADPPLEIAAGTTPNVSAEGNYDTVEWATGETTDLITTTFVVPADYVSGLSLIVVTAHDGATDDDETISLSWYAAGDGDADNPTVVNEAATACTYAQTLSSHTIALDGGTIAAGDVVRMVLGFAVIDETVHLISTRIIYTATQ